MRYLLPVLLLAAIAVTPSVALGVGACAVGAGTTTAQQETKGKQEAKAPQGERGDRQVLVTQKTK